MTGLHYQSEDGPNTQRIAVVDQIAHPGYPGANDIANDIALLRLAEPIQFDYATVHYACMPQARVQIQTNLIARYLIADIISLLFIL